MDNNYYSKTLYLTIEITQLLKKYGCTYNEADEILKLVIDEINQQRESLEFNTIDDFIKQKKTHNVDNDVIHALNHVKPYF